MPNAEMVAGPGLRRWQDAYELAGGITFANQRRAEDESWADASIALRAALILSHLGDTLGYPETLRLQGEQALQGLVENTLGTYVRNVVSLNIDDSFRTSFNFDLIIEGSEIEESGTLILPQRHHRLGFQKGKERVLEILRGRTKVVHLVEGEGVLLTKRGKTVAIWTPPNLTENPVYGLSPLPDNDYMDSPHNNPYWRRSY